VRRYIPELDGLRGIAIALVMLHRLFPRTGGASPWFVEAGWIGVDLFFVVSGYLIAGILLDTRDDPDYFRNFYARRILRIFPLFYVLVGGMLLVFPLLGHGAFVASAGSPLWYLLQLGNVPEAVLGRDPPYWLAPVWSLAIEEQFYLTFPLLVRSVDRRALGWWLAGAAALALAARTVTALAWPANERLQYQFTLCRLDAIAAGCALALIARDERVLARVRRWLPAAMLGALAVALATRLDRTTVFGRTLGYTVVATGFAAVVLHVTLRRTAWLRFPPLRYLGKLCFGLYLLHRPADTFVTAAVARLGLDPDRLAWLPVKIAVAVALASASWVAIEQPFLRRKRRFVSPRLALATTAVLLAGCTARRTDPRDGGRDVITLADAGRDGPGDALPPPPPLGHLVYPEARVQSPLTPDVVAHLQAIAALGPDQRDDAVAKVGDSITASPSFVTCFDGSAWDLGGHDELAAVRTDFAPSFGRTSLAAVGGWTAADPLAGAPPPLDQETSAIAPRLALVMLGTNDDRYGRPLAAFGGDLWTIVDRLIARGVVPILSTIPAIHGDPDADHRVALFDGVVRALAQGYSLPLVDFHAALASLPDEGISADGIHPTVAPAGACVLTAAGLAYGYNLRNLVSLEALARTRAALAGTASDATGPRRTGAGTLADPYRATLPLADLADTGDGEPASACGGGRGVVYQLALAQPTAVAAFVVERGATDVDVRLAQDGTCLASGAVSASATLAAGPAQVIVASRSGAAEGPFAVVVQPQ
jgi:peptidoglycan/LPS O-acetylase OafA/YrhL